MKLIFNSLDRLFWLRLVSAYRKELCSYCGTEPVVIIFSQELSPSHIQPLHIVSLACLIEFASKRGHDVRMDNVSDIGKYLFNIVKFKEYWAGGKNNVTTQYDDIFKLWRLVDSEKESYSLHVHNYLQSKYFKNKDLSAVKVSLDEAMYNVFDHSESGDLAFLMISYNSEKQQVKFAVCDFGIGIAECVRKKEGDKADIEAVALALKDGYTAGSKEHNRGYGINNIMQILFDSNFMQIITNKALVVATTSGQKILPLDFCFHGTVISWDISLSELYDEDIIDNLSF